jgi:cell division protein FtsL
VPGVRRRVQPPGRRATPPSGPSLITFFFWTLFLVSAAIIYLWIYNQTEVLTADLMTKRRQILELEHTNRELQVDIDNLMRIDRITQIARTQLGMYVPPAESLVVSIAEAGK